MIPAFYSGNAKVLIFHTNNYLFNDTFYPKNNALYLHLHKHNNTSYPDTHFSTFSYLHIVIILFHLKT
ncbi:hypothetical protein CK934_06970 [Chitinophaga sp. MD30]|nr:hypothetical protein CK934_06970 [Chitinophaga sp. MD30]